MRFSEKILSKFLKIVSTKDSESVIKGDTTNDGWYQEDNLKKTKKKLKQEKEED